MGKHITEKERYQIEILLKEGYKPQQIADILNKCVRTIYYEIKRGKTVQRESRTWTEKEVYLADVAQRKYEEHKSNCGRNLKIGNDYKLIEYIEYWIGKERYSPYAVLRKIKNKQLSFKAEICVKTLYNYIDQNLFLNISNKNLPAKKAGIKRPYKRTVALNNIKGRTIEDRPKNILKRTEYGHWELDTVVGGKNKGKACLLVFSERMTREEIIMKLESKTSAAVVQALNRLEKEKGEKKFRETFKTITCDNGCEFLDFLHMQKSRRNKTLPRTQVYYCHPYCASERGTNENTNKLIRRWIPKGADIGAISQQEIKRIEHWINNYPRKIFEGKSSDAKKKEAFKAS